ncbi:SCO family protein [Bacillus sp. EB01]|uniref:SCO family protein n=1 Tax=Bacillus sp. EB01 TaxID=1347086 RepID=UPI0022AEB4DB|nr:SCO family protein [Bacillus sp. EB01]
MFYTNCPDICPLTMIDFAKMQAELKKEGVFGEKVELLAITLDPETDSLEILKKYAQNFQTDPSGWKFLRGSIAETIEIADSYHMKFQKVNGGAIAHNTTMYLIDKDNQII